MLQFWRFFSSRKSWCCKFNLVFFFTNVNFDLACFVSKMWWIVSLCKFGNSSLIQEMEWFIWSVSKSLYWLRAWTWAISLLTSSTAFWNKTFFAHGVGKWPHATADVVFEFVCKVLCGLVVGWCPPCVLPDVATWNWRNLRHIKTAKIAFYAVG